MKPTLAFLLLPILAAAVEIPLSDLDGIYADPATERSAEVDLSAQGDLVARIAVRCLAEVTPGSLALCGEPQAAADWWSFAEVLLTDAAGPLARAVGGMTIPGQPFTWFEFEPLADDAWVRAAAGPFAVRMCWYPEDYVLIYCPLAAPVTDVRDAALLVTFGEVPVAAATMSLVKRGFR